MPLHPFNLIRPPDLFPCGSANGPLLLPEIVVPSTDETEEPLPSFCGQIDGNFLAKIEAVLFLSREPLSERRLSQYAELPEGSRLRTLIKDLNQRYDARQCAFRIVEVAGGFQLRTRPKLVAWLVRRQEIPTTVKLSPPAMETLAVIAYRQPVHRAEIERIRGVQCGELIRQLLERDLVRIVGRSEELGRPYFYGTTKNFLQVFGLGSLRELSRRELFPTNAVDKTASAENDD